MTFARLNGLYPSDFVADGRLSFAIGRPAPEGRPVPSIEIADARALQAGHSEAAFFAEHGFALLPHPTRVRDWDQDIAGTYLDEVEALIRERLLPGRRVEIQQRPWLLRRGRGTGTPYYAEGVHSDFGMTLEDYAVSIEAFTTPEAARNWLARYARDDVLGFLSIDLWRTTNMRAPLRHMPLALCDPGSVETADLIDTAITGIAPSGKPTHHLSLRFNAGQRWCFYPEMTGDEVLAFKLFECWKDEDGRRLRSCFHSAFRDPDAPSDAEARQSCEHRVGVLVLRD